MFDAEFDKYTGVTRCNGVKIDHIVFKNIDMGEPEHDVLKSLSHYVFDKERQMQKGNKYTQNVMLDHYQLISPKLRTIDDLKWIKKVACNENNMVKVSYAGPSMRDVQNVLRLVDKDFGSDFSGIDSSGNRVMGLVIGGALASIVKPDQDLLWPVPNHWTLEEAATVPLPYIHAFYCLTVRSRLHAGHSVFVTGGAGAFGQAVISICLSLGCTVYTSVGDIRKKMFLMKLFPDLNGNNIGYSYDNDFYNMVMRNSKTLRCDVVINCATGGLRELAMNCVASFGYFLDLSKFDMNNNKPFGMWYLEEDKTYKTIDLSNLFRPENVDEKKLLQKVISEGISNGTVKPISYVVYPPEEISKAFRLLSLCRHRGCCCFCRPLYSSTGIYFIECSKNIELGVQLATHLVKNGAKKLVLNLTSISGFIGVQLVHWKNLGASVSISNEDLKEKNNCTNILKTEESVNGIFIIVRDDENAIHDYVSASSVVDNLDEVTKNNCPHLRFFVVLTNTHENGNKINLTFLEKICERRIKFGLPALLLRTEMLNDSLNPLKPNTVFKTLEKSLHKNYTDNLAYNEIKDQCKFYKTVANIIGTKDIHSVDNNLRVKDLICNESNFEELKSVIKDIYYLELPVENLAEMTIYSLQNLNKLRTKQNTKFDSKYDAFYRVIDDNEINATEIFMTMSNSTEEQEDAHVRANNIMLIPGFEGHRHIFKELCKRLKIQATTLQLGPDLAKDNIHEIAVDLKERIKRRFILKPKFYLLGYSFGVNVALEIASLLEKDGLVGVVYCLDSSPDALRVQLDAYLGISSEAQLQNSIIKHIFYLMSGQNCPVLEQILETMDDWGEKVAISVEKLKGVVKFSNDFKKDIIKGFYNKINLARSYRSEFKLKSKLVLLKGIPHPKAECLPADYGLSKYAKDPVTVLNINCDVVSAPYDVRVANIVNTFLDPELVEENKTLNFYLSDNYSQF